jgi:hypothetical protein
LALEEFIRNPWKWPVSMAYAKQKLKRPILALTPMGKAGLPLGQFAVTYLPVKKRKKPSPGK